ncbi:hypothetical protein MMYC01_202424 [Madurella mycetomatis]|uniref:Uncharacterized protein n=1 Tax=Madurella mycetomatis TaxID=100816 RepID=A0A175W8N1_9PEZI|nr:hypothetical protein MMYC01_202424 [Madurella mycetomatis]
MEEFTRLDDDEAWKGEFEIIITINATFDHEASVDIDVNRSLESLLRLHLVTDEIADIRFEQLSAVLDAPLAQESSSKVATEANLSNLDRIQGHILDKLPGSLNQSTLEFVRFTLRTLITMGEEQSIPFFHPLHSLRMRFEGNVRNVGEVPDMDGIFFPCRGLV